MENVLVSLKLLAFRIFLDQGIGGLCDFLERFSHVDLAGKGRNFQSQSGVFVVIQYSQDEEQHNHLCCQCHPKNGGWVGVDGSIVDLSVHDSIQERNCVVTNR